MILETHIDKEGRKYWTVICNGPRNKICVEAETRSEAFYQAVCMINEQAMEKCYEVVNESRN